MSAALVIIGCLFVAIVVLVDVRAGPKPPPRTGEQLRKAKALQAAQEILDG